MDCRLIVDSRARTGSNNRVFGRSLFDSEDKRECRRRIAMYQASGALKDVHYSSHHRNPSLG